MKLPVVCILVLGVVALCIDYLIRGCDAVGSTAAADFVVEGTAVVVLDFAE